MDYPCILLFLHRCRQCELCFQPFHSVLCASKGGVWFCKGLQKVWSKGTSHLQSSVVSIRGGAGRFVQWSWQQREGMLQVPWSISA